MRACASALPAALSACRLREACPIIIECPSPCRSWRGRFGARSKATGLFLPDAWRSVAAARSDGCSS
eukprot:5648863-Alexandrium_andersonii.AAC.1